MQCVRWWHTVVSHVQLTLRCDTWWHAVCKVAAHSHESCTVNTEESYHKVHAVYTCVSQLILMMHPYKRFTEYPISIVVKHEFVSSVWSVRKWATSRTPQCESVEGGGGLQVLWLFYNYVVLTFEVAVLTTISTGIDLLFTVRVALYLWLWLKLRFHLCVMRMRQKIETMELV